jgi:hypothetical protein
MLKNVFLLKSYRNTFNKFKNYQNSLEWRSKLSNLTNIWNLSIFNILSIVSVCIIIIVKIAIGLNTSNFIFLNQDGTINYSLWQLWLQDLGFTLGFCLIILLFTFLINVFFVIFPLKFPINPHALITLSEANKKKIKEVVEEKKEEIIFTPEIKTPKLPPTVSSQIKKKTLPTIKIDLSADRPVTKKEIPTETDLTDEMLNIPPPPMKKAINAKINELDLDIPNMDEIMKKDTDEIKHILVEDTIDNKNIIVPVPRELVLNAKEPVVEITYITGDPKHAVVIQVDHDFQVRRRRASQVIFED